MFDWTPDESIKRTEGGNGFARFPSGTVGDEKESPELEPHILPCTDLRIVSSSAVFPSVHMIPAPILSIHAHPRETRRRRVTGYIVFVSTFQPLTAESSLVTSWPDTNIHSLPSP